MWMLEKRWTLSRCMGLAQVPFRAPTGTIQQSHRFTSNQLESVCVRAEHSKPIWGVPSLGSLDQTDAAGRFGYDHRTLAGSRQDHNWSKGQDVQPNRRRGGEILLDRQTQRAVKPMTLSLLDQWREERTSVLTADEAGLMEAPPVTLDLLCMVHRLLTGCALGTSSPVWHLGETK